MCVNVCLIMYYGMYILKLQTKRRLPTLFVCTYCAWPAVDNLVTETVGNILLIIMSAIQKNHYGTKT